jgi:hypothetical protein
MENKNKLAVEWFDEQLQDKMFIQYGYSDGLRKIVIPIDAYMELKQQAKEMEKEQIINAFDMGCQDEDRIGEEYYNETYNK